MVEEEQSTVTAPSEIPLQSPAQKSLEKFLNKPMRIELSDGRIVIGNLVCTDNVPNIILQGSQEYWLKDWPNGYIRDLGVVVIGGKHIKSIRVLKEDHNT